MKPRKNRALFCLKNMKKTTQQTLTIFWEHIKPYRLMFFAMLIFVSGAIIINLLTPIFFKQFFDTLAASSTNVDETGKELIKILFIILGLSMGSWLLFRAAGLLHANFQSRAVRDLLDSNFEYLHKHSYHFFVNRFVGSLVRQINRLVRSFEDIMDRLIWDLVPLFVRITVILVVLFSMGKISIALAMLGWTIVYMTLNYFYSVYKLKYDVQHSETNSRVTAHLADSVTNNQTIKLFAALPQEIKAYKKLTQEQFKIHLFTWYLGEYSIMLQSFLMIILEFGVLYLAVQGWQQGVFTIGDFALIQAYIIALFGQLWGFGRVIRKLYENFADAEEMTEILNMPHEVADKSGAKSLKVQKGEIEFKEVTFAYNKTRTVINNFNLKINPGERIGLVGPSGAGKSTLTSLLFRNYDVTGGKILIDGQKISEVTQNSLRKNISLVPQDPILFHRSLKENIRYGRPGATDKEVLKAAQLAHCHEFIKELPEQYDTLVGERGIKLSGGERQRVAIARAIVKDAPILVLDEATSSLDSESERLIQDALSNLMQGKTTIVIAHRLSTIMQMDRIIVVEDGKIVEEGSHEELLKAKQGTYQKLWNIQVGSFVG